MRLPVITAADGAPWEAGLVAALERGDHGLVIARRCVDVVELLAVASVGQAQAALVGSGLRRLDADAVDRLRAAEVVPVGVVRRGDAAAEERLRAAGVVHLVADDADPSVMASVVTAAVADRSAGMPLPRSFGDPQTSLASRPDATGAIPPGGPEPLPDTDRASTHGSVIAVWGPTGAPGRTTLAVHLADELARLGMAALLIDGDVYGGTVAAVLGLLDESPGLAAACRHAAGARLDPPALAGLCWQVNPSFRVLTGIPLAQRWTEVRAAAMEPVLTAARALADFTVVDCGFALETDEELSFDSLAPRRNGATLAVLDAADVIIAVGAADPIGMQRIVRGLAELREAEVTAPVWVVLNKVRRGVVPGSTSRELAAALERFAGCSPAALLPYDVDALDTALATGRLLAEARRSSALRVAIAELAGALSGVSTGQARHARRRR
jgi:Flp pilus assembly CpaE family ATPase